MLSAAQRARFGAFRDSEIAAPRKLIRVWPQLGYHLLAPLSWPVVPLDSALARALLGPSRAEELARRVERSPSSRADVVDAADAERRRIERDLHDGAQQRLVSLAMNLGMARATLTDLPGPARPVIDAGARRGQAGPRGAARPGPRPASGRPRRPGPRRGAVRDRRPRAAAGRLTRRRWPRRPRATHRGRRLLRRLRGADQRRQARRRHPGRRRRVDRAGDRLRVVVTDDGRGRRATATAAPGCAGLAQRVGRRRRHVTVQQPARRARPPSPWSCRAGRDRRGLRAAAGRADQAARPTAASRWWPPSGDAEALLRGRRPSTGPTSPWSTCGCRPTHTDEGMRAALVIRRAVPGRRASWCSPSTSRSATPPICSPTATSGGRLPAQGPGRRRRRVPRRAAPGGGRRHRPRPRGGRPAAASAAGADPLDRLTPREREVLALMAEGRSNAASPSALRGQRERGREAREQHLHQAGPAADRRRPPPGPRGAEGSPRLGLRPLSS